MTFKAVFKQKTVIPFLCFKITSADVAVHICADMQIGCAFQRSFPNMWWTLKALKCTITNSGLIEFVNMNIHIMSLHQTPIQDSGSIIKSQF